MAEHSAAAHYQPPSIHFIFTSLPHVVRELASAEIDLLLRRHRLDEATSLLDGRKGSVQLLGRLSLGRIAVCDRSIGFVGREDGARTHSVYLVLIDCFPVHLMLVLLGFAAWPATGKKMTVWNQQILVINFHLCQQVLHYFSYCGLYY